MCSSIGSNAWPENDPATTVTRDAWAIPFLGLLGYELRYNQRAYEVDGLSFAISHRAGEAEDAPPVHIVGERQELGRVPASGRPRLAPHSLVQEYLNRTEQVWGIVTNGATLRLLRDSTFVPAAGLRRVRSPLDPGRPALPGFLCVVSPAAPDPAAGGGDGSDCLLEQYYTAPSSRAAGCASICVTVWKSASADSPPASSTTRQRGAAPAGSPAVTPATIRSGRGLVPPASRS